MSTNANDLLTHRGDSEPMQIDPRNSFGEFERRRRERLTLHWNVYLFRQADSCPLISRTRDISSDGFYCIVDKPLTPGEQIYCDIIIPPHVSLTQSGGASIHCHVQVLRVQTAGNGSYGIACRIEEYSFDRWKAQTISPATTKFC
jgi:hypothetical protein